MDVRLYFHRNILTVSVGFQVMDVERVCAVAWQEGGNEVTPLLTHTLIVHPHECPRHTHIHTLTHT